MEQTELHPAGDEVAPDDGNGRSPLERSGRPEQRAVLSRVDRALRDAAGSVLDRYPRLETPLFRLRDRYTKAWIRYTAVRHNLVHSAPIDPYRIGWIDPARIEYISQKASRPRFKRMGAVVGGDWDDRVRRFTDTVLYRGFEARFEEGRAWEDTAFYRHICEQLAAGQTRWNCTSQADLDERCARLDEFYRTVQVEGFRTQRELAAEDADEPISRDRESVHARIVNDEVAVDVGRRGGLFFADGRNRLAIAKLLDVEALPVLFLRRHPTWVAFRDAVADHVATTGVMPDEIAAHPDLRQLADR